MESAVEVRHWQKRNKVRSLSHGRRPMPLECALLYVCLRAYVTLVIELK